MSMLKLIIKRSKWLRGEDNWKSYLLRKDDKKMCCLGFLALKSGHTNKEVLNIQIPSEIQKDNKFPHNIIKNGRCTKTCFSLMGVNDDGNIDEAKREYKLTKLFKRINIRAQFVD